MVILYFVEAVSSGPKNNIAECTKIRAPDTAHFSGRKCADSSFPSMSPAIIHTQAHQKMGKHEETLLGIPNTKAVKRSHQPRFTTLKLSIVAK
ncbi:hypothetical protein AVEN_19290-1 [Araneus ventricosus]|uniref:Uncharacterized protein n=1 Tax=Araneus ventricosus TaxID=182803 RepID=A0A4Y2MWL6_ARAVE|nr:hypothetical protein AVEN_19290-1 [Araneus ventricosus]